jgi:hypothetical protein
MALLKGTVKLLIPHLKNVSNPVPITETSQEVISIKLIDSPVKNKIILGIKKLTPIIVSEPSQLF